MTYKAPKNWKDLLDNKPLHHGLSRRDFLARGMATGAMSVAVHQSIFGHLINQAAAATLTCPPPVKNIGSIGQIYAEGGPTMGARFFSESQAAMMNVNMAGNYGISGQANLQKLGPN